MAGFKPQRKTYKLDFSGTDLDGLEVIVGSVPIGTLLELQETYEKLGSQNGTAESGKVLRELFAIFTRALKSWNLLDEDDQPVPVSLDGALSQDADLVLAVIKAWGAAMGSVPAPLAGGSRSGEPALEASLQMDVLSPSQVS